MSKEEALRLMNNPMNEEISYLLKDFLMRTPEEQELIVKDIEDRGEFLVEETLILMYVDEPVSLGKYGELFRQFMTEQHPIRKSFLMTEGIFLSICEEVQEEAIQMRDLLLKQYKEKFPRPITDKFMELIHWETTRTNYAEEIVMQEIVYKMR